MNESDFFVREHFCPRCDRALERVNSEHYYCHECKAHFYPRRPIIRVFLGYYTEPDEKGEFYSVGKCVRRP